MHLVQPLNLAYVKSILIVDDSPLIRRSLRSVFEQQLDGRFAEKLKMAMRALIKPRFFNPT